MKTSYWRSHYVFHKKTKQCSLKNENAGKKQPNFIGFHHLFQYCVSYHSFFRVCVIFQMLTYKYNVFMIYIHSVMFIWINKELFNIIYDFCDHFAFCKATMRDRVMKKWFKKGYHTRNGTI